MDTEPISVFESFVTPARERLTNAARHLVDAVLTTESTSDEDLEHAAVLIETVVADLKGTLPTTRDSRRARVERNHSDYIARSPVLGAVSPLAPPLHAVWDGSTLELTGQFPTACEGPPGYVHGGWIAMAFDEALGFAAVASGHPGMTGKLVTKYRLPTPVVTDIRIRAWLESVNGRLATMRCEMLVGDDITAEGEGLFIDIGEELARQYFGND